MKKLLVTLFALVGAVGMAHAGASKNEILQKYKQHAAKVAAQPYVTLRALSSGSFAPLQVTANGQCDGSEPFTVIHDDGSAEDGYGWNAAANVGKYVDKFTPQLYPASVGTVCLAMLTNAGVTSFDLTIAVYDDDGTDGAPGSLLGEKTVTTEPQAIAGLPANPSFESFDLSDLDIDISDGSVYIGVQWDASTAPDGVFIAADESEITPSADGYMASDGGAWAPIVDNTPTYRALFVRATLPNTGPGAPGVREEFDPTQIQLGETSTLTITLDNRSQSSAAVLASDFTDSFPADLVVASTPMASTTCDNATLSADGGADHITLASGAEIPAGGTCKIQVDVTSSVDGAYENVIPAGALDTQFGSNPNPATATVQVGFIFPEPYCETDYTISVEPISRVQFADIDNSSDPTIDGTPALQDFTSIIGHVDPGATVQMIVEGNTNGPYTTPIKVYIDWNHNQVFDADEGYLIGALDTSTGSDGQQAIGTITVPVDAMQGETRMRVTKNFNSPAPACGDNSFGQAEDYTLDVAALNPAPRVSKSFAPTIVPEANDPSTMTITLTNDQNSGDATLTADFTDTFPSGLVVAPTPNASTTCIDGDLTADAGADSITLASGAKIPGEESCEISVDVTSATEDVYTNLIPAGALQTDKGDSPFDASADLQVGYIFPEPYCEIDFTASVEPISRVQFADIDNSSDPTVDGTPALQNFTSIVGHVFAGRSVSMALEGNTNGSFTNVFKVYIDWNQNDKFDSDEGYLIGSISGSDGTDGQQAVADIDIPADAMTGDTRMRVTKSFLSAAPACGDSSFGQAEDYTLNVSPAKPKVSKSFAPDTVQLGDPSTATITIDNLTPNDATLTAPLVDTFPAGLTVSDVSTDCGLVLGIHAGVSNAAGGNEVTLPSGVMVPAGESCSITATVQASAAGTYTNVIPAGDLQTDQGNNPLDAEATLTVVNSPYVTASFNPTTVQRTKDSTATITLVNPGSSDATLTASFTDTLPTGLVATGATTSCIAGTSSVHANLAASSATLPSGTVIPAHDSCDLVLTVHSDSLGTYDNVIPAGALQTDQGDNLAEASATLTVVALPSDPVIGVTPDGLDTTQASNTTTSQTITIANTGGSDLNWNVSAYGTLSSGNQAVSGSSAGSSAGSGAAPSGNSAIDLRTAVGGQFTPFTVNAAGNCGPSVPGMIIHDDGTAENGYGWNPSAGYARLADKFTPDAYPATINNVCAAFITNAGATSLDFTIAVYDDDGPNGKPGTELGSMDFTAHPEPIAGVPAQPSFESFDISSLGIGVTDGSVYISVEWDASTAPDGAYIAADESTSTPMAGGYYKTGSSDWAPIQSINTGYRALFIRAAMPLAGACPTGSNPDWLSVTPSSGTTAPGDADDVTVSFDSTDMVSGTYSASLCISSNDPVTPIVTLPVTMTVEADEPSATVTPTSLDFSVPADETASQDISIADASGSDALTFSIGARSPKDARIHLQPSNAEMKHAARFLAAHPPQLAASNTGAMPMVQDQPWSPMANAPATSSSFPFMYDDGSAENAIGFGSTSSESMAIFFDRFAPPEGSGAYTITDVSIMWPDADMAGGSLAGLTANLVFYYDFDSDGDPSNAFRLGGDQFVTIDTTGEFVDYPVSISVPGDGDIYVGFADQWAQGGDYTPKLFPAALDQTSPMGMSWVSASSEGVADLDNLANNDTTDVIGNLDATLAGNWMIRAVGVTGNSCTGPAVSWLSAAPSSGSVNPDDSMDVTVTVDPGAGDLGTGTYQAELCITTNDPDQSLIALPITLKVTQSDGIFCDGFDGGDGSCDPSGQAPADGGNVIGSGPVNIALPATFSGLYVNWLTGATCRSDANNCDGQLDFYTDSSGHLAFLWPERSIRGSGGVATAGGNGYAVLQQGDVVGPASPLLNRAGAAGNGWHPGTDGYLGFAFDCSSMGGSPSGICYGYAHIKMHAGHWTLVGYAYDAGGAAIKIE